MAFDAPFYTIRIAGLLDSGWSEWFDGLSIEPGGAGETVLAGYLVDQAALHSILAKVRDLNLTLVSLQREQGDCL